ncbi:MAG: Sec-independent protein translocase TatB [Actinobacteria bacterium]|nr:Sec-independent protein translocase TatB [Actinomycetota bacterium]
MFSGWEVMVLLMIVLLVVGPDKLPEIARQLGSWTRMARDLIREAKSSLKDELGDEISDLRSLDPRQYDPRRIVREALMEDTPPRPASRPAPRQGPGQPGRPAAATTGSAAASETNPDEPPAAPFDDEAT